MTIRQIEIERNQARVEGNQARLIFLNDVLAKIRRKETGKDGATGRVEITEKIVDETLIEYRKMLKEGIKMSPEGHAVRTNYEAQLKMLMEFCPPVMDNEIEVENLITDFLYSKEVPISEKNRGLIMRTLMPVFRAQRVDMDVAMPIIDFMISQAESAS